MNTFETQTTELREMWCAVHFLILTNNGTQTFKKMITSNCNCNTRTFLLPSCPRWRKNMLGENSVLQWKKYWLIVCGLTSYGRYFVHFCTRTIYQSKILYILHCTNPTFIVLAHWDNSQQQQVYSDSKATSRHSFTLNTTCMV